MIRDYCGTLKFAEKQGRMLETVTLNSCAGTVAAPASVITELFDLSLMRFQQRDDVAETFRKYSHKVQLCHDCALVTNVLSYSGRHACVAVVRETVLTKLVPQLHIIGQSMGVSNLQVQLKAQ